MKSKDIIKTVYIVAVALIILLSVRMYLNDKTIVFFPKIDYSDSREAYFTDYMALDRGDYGVTIDYGAQEDTEVAMYLDNSDESYPAVLDKNENQFFYELHLDEYNDLIHFGYAVDDPDEFVLKSIQIESKQSLFTDYLFLAGFVLVISDLLFFVVTSNSFKNIPINEKVWFIACISAIIVASIPLYSRELFWGADDPAHVMRLEGIKEALLNRQFPVFVFPKNDCGYGLLGYMYPSLFMYIPAVMRIFRVSIPFAMNSLYVAINSLTAIVAFFSVREIYEKKETAYMFTLLYLLLPYRLVNIYTRADVGESLGMCFLPMLIAAMYMCLDENKRKNTLKTVCYMTIGMTALIHSHVLSTVLTLVFMVIYAIIFIKRLANRECIRNIGISVLCTGLINIGFIVPFIKLYSFGLNFSDMRNKVFSGKFSLLELLEIHDFSDGSAWGGIAPIGVLGIIILIVGIVLTIRRERTFRDNFMMVSGIFGVLLFAMVPSEFPWDAILSIAAIKRITDVLQFSFRVIMYAAPLFAMVTAYYLYDKEIDIKIKRAVTIIVTIVAFLSVLPGIFGEMNMEPYMGRLSGGASDIVLREYWPEGVTDGVFNDDRLYWSSEDLEFEEYEKNGLRVGFRYNTQPGKDEWIEPPILYYPGYKAVATDAEGNKYNLGVTQGNYYRVRVDLPSGISGSSVKLYYGGLWYFYIAYAISVVSAVAFALVIISRLRLKRKEA